MAKHTKLLWTGFAGVVISTAALSTIAEGVLVGGCLLLVAGVMSWIVSLK